MKRTLFAYSIIPMLGLGLFLGTSAASAHGFGMGVGSFMGGIGGRNATPEEIATLATRQQDMFQREATILGITVDEVKEAWAQGTSMSQLITEKNLNKDEIAARLKAAQLADLKAQLQTLVSKGIITQAQADTRLQTVETRIKNGPTKKDQKKMGGGMRHGMGI